MTGRRREQGEPTRFAEGGRGDALDHRIGACFRRAMGVPGLSEARIDAIGRALRPPAGTLRRPVFQLAAALALILCAGGATALARRGERVMIHRWASRIRDTAHLAQHDGSLRPVAVASHPVATLMDSVAAPIDSVAAPTSPVAAPSVVWTPPPARRHESASSHAVASPHANGGLPPEAAVESISTLGAEARLLRRAIETLRTERDPQRALGLLDEYRATFPGGHLHANADLLRVDALLLLHRRAEALALLDAALLDAGPRADDLLITRGELRAESDCTRALRDFDQALARALPDKQAERALRGRAVCRMQVAGLHGAEEDLRAYLRRFPSGKFAARVRELLDGQ